MKIRESEEKDRRDDDDDNDLFLLNDHIFDTTVYSILCFSLFAMYIFIFWLLAPLFSRPHFSQPSILFDIFCGNCQSQYTRGTQIDNRCWHATGFGTGQDHQLGRKDIMHLTQTFART